MEEALFLGGDATLSAEGDFQAGDYFWRPPGWVHAARSGQGFECVLMMEGETPAEGSGRVSRVIRPDEDAGRSPSPAPPTRSGRAATSAGWRAASWCGAPTTTR